MYSELGADGEEAIEIEDIPKRTFTGQLLDRLERILSKQWEQLSCLDDPTFAHEIHKSDRHQHIHHRSHPDRELIR